MQHLSLGAAANNYHRGCAGSQCACANQGPEDQAGVGAGVGQAGTGVGQRSAASVEPVLAREATTVTVTGPTVTPEVLPVAVRL
jgi:hypothetical protein